MKTEAKLITEGCKFWFNDHEHIRSPFPKNIQKELKEKASDLFMGYANDLTEKDKEEVTEEELLSIFEMFLFSSSVELIGIENKDKILSVHYPFLPRTGDKVNDKDNGESTITSREVYEKEINEQKEKKLYMKVSLESLKGRKWETEFEVPA